MNSLIKNLRPIIYINIVTPFQQENLLVSYILLTSLIINLEVCLLFYGKRELRLRWINVKYQKLYTLCSR